MEFCHYILLIWASLFDILTVIPFGRIVAFEFFDLNRYDLIIIYFKKTVHPTQNSANLRMPHFILLHVQNVDTNEKKKRKNSFDFQWFLSTVLQITEQITELI